LLYETGLPKLPDSSEGEDRTSRFSLTQEEVGVDILSTLHLLLRKPTEKRAQPLKAWLERFAKEQSFIFELTPVTVFNEWACDGVFLYAISKSVLYTWKLSNQMTVADAQLSFGAQTLYYIACTTDGLFVLLEDKTKENGIKMMLMDKNRRLSEVKYEKKRRGTSEAHVLKGRCVVHIQCG